MEIDVEEALIDLVKAVQDAEIDHELEDGQNGEGPVARALIALGRKNIYAINMFLDEDFGDTNRGTNDDEEDEDV